MRILAIFAAAFALAAAAFVYGMLDVSVLWAAGLLAALSPVVWRLGLRRCSVAALGVAVGLLWCVGYRVLWLSPVYRAHETQLIRTVEVLDAPERTAYGVRMTVSVELEGRTYEGTLYGESALETAKPGDRVTAELRAEVSAPENTWLWAQGSVLRFFAESEATVTAGTPAATVQARLWLQARIGHLYTGDAAGFLLALLTGDRSGLSPQIQNDLSVAGLSHVVAVSGMHVSLLLAMVAVCCGDNPRLTALIGIPVAWFFALLTGASPSALRAAVMQTVLLVAPLVRREYDSPTALAAAALLLLLQNPYAIASVSFQLSFAAVAGLLLFASPIQQRLLSRQKRPGRIRRALASACAATLSATAMTLPLTIWYFGLVSMVAVLTNLLCLWAVTAVFVLGLISCFLGGIFSVPASLLAQFVLHISRWLAAFPYAAAYPQNLPLMIWAVLAYGAAYAVLLGKRRWAAPVWTGLLAALLACVLWGRYTLLVPAYRVLDVGQGQAVLMTHGGFTAVLDCGGEKQEAAGETVARTLHSGGQTQVDVLALTHYDSDHAGGALQLLHRTKVGMVLLPDVPDETGMREAIEAAAKAAGSRVIHVTEQAEVTFSDGKLSVYPSILRENDNNCGICVLATAGECDMLITGDLDRLQEQRLLQQWSLPQAEFLVAGHHGARDSTSWQLLEQIQPEAVILSVGADNPYGHPDPVTMYRLETAGVPVLRTDRDGTIRLYTQ